VLVTLPPTIRMASLAVTVVTAVAVTDVELPEDAVMVPGVTSKTDGSTPEKATIAPAFRLEPVPSVNVKLVPSVPSATRYRTVWRVVPELMAAPAISVHPVRLALVVLLPAWTMSAIITSPATTPVGLLITMVVVVLLVVVVAAPRCAMAAKARELLSSAIMQTQSARLIASPPLRCWSWLSTWEL